MLVSKEYISSLKYFLNLDLDSCLNRRIYCSCFKYNRIS